MQRKVSFDLLRVLAMWFIMTAHFMGWGGVVNTLTTRDLNYFWVMPLYFASQIGNSLFFMLSGYFAKEPRLDKILLIERKSAFYSSVITWAVFAVGGVSLSYAVQSMFPLFFKRYWFVRVYLALYALEFLLVPGLKNLNKKQFFVVIIALTLNNILTENAQYTLLEGLLAFIIGFYIRQFKPFAKKRNTSIFCLYLVLMLIYSIERLIILKLGLEHSKFDINARYVLLLAAATVLFGFFTELDVRWKWPGKLSPYILSVYLITANPAISELLYKNVLHAADLSTRIYFFPYYIASNAFLLLLCVTLDRFVTRINTFEVKILMKIIPPV